MVKFAELGSIAIILVGFIIVVSIGADVIGGIEENQCDEIYDDGACRTCGSSGFAYNTTANNCYNTTNSSMTIAYNSSQTAAFNVSEDGLEGLTTFGSYSPTLATVFIAGIILTVIGGIFFMGRRGEY